MVANEAYKKADYETALRQTFLKMDDMIRDEKGRAEIKAIQK